MSPVRPRVGPGTRVHVVAPAWAVEAERLAAGLAVLRTWGLEPVVGEAVTGRWRYFAASDRDRASAFEAALEDASAPLLWVARGGSGSARLLDVLTPQRVRAADKDLVGFSDATALHALWRRAGCSSVHGPNVTTLAEATSEVQVELFDLLAGGAPRAFEGRWDGPSRTVVGPLFGGNLTVLAALAGTPYLPDLRGTLLLLEDVDERTYRLERSLVQLVQAGVLGGVVGVVLGLFTRCAPSHGDPATAEEVLLETLAPLDVPVLSGVPLGHDAAARAVRLGQPWTLVPTGAGRGRLVPTGSSGLRPRGRLG